MVPSTDRLRIALVEPFYAGSHAAWADGYQHASAHDVRLITRPAGPWRWRLQSSGTSLGAELAGAGRRRPFDAVVVSSMTDVAHLAGVARRSIGGAPVIAYRHESQLLYPQVPGEKLPAGIALSEWAGLIAADRVIFNSEFHRGSLLAALPNLLASGDEAVPTELIDVLAARSAVIPVGVDLSVIGLDQRVSNDGRRPTVLFPHRWHHDKDPEGFLDAALEVASRGVDFELIMCGDDDLPDTAAIDRRLRRLGDRVVSAEFLDREAYVRALHRSDIVVSTATQEFFGVAVVEAIAAGCVPLLPDDLAYPDVVPGRFHASALGPREALTDRLEATLTDLVSAREKVNGLAAAMNAYDWSAVAPELDAFVEAEVARHRGRR